MISDKHTQMFLSICNFGEKAVTALSRMQPPNDVTSETLPSPFQTTAGISCSERHAGWHFYFANSRKHPSLLSSGHTVSSKWYRQSTASTHPTWNKPDFKVWIMHSIPWMHPLVSLHPLSWQVCMPQVSMYDKEQKAKTRNPPVLSYFWFNPLSVGEKHPIRSVNNHCKFSLLTS